MTNRFIILASLTFSIGCGADVAQQPDGPRLGDPPGVLAQSSRDRIVAPQISDSDAATLRRDTTTFALAVQRSAPSGVNVVFSPHSMQLALAMCGTRRGAVIAP